MYVEENTSTFYNLHTYIADDIFSPIYGIVKSFHSEPKKPSNFALQCFGTANFIFHYMFQLFNIT